MTPDDLKFLQYMTDQRLNETRDAIARMRPPKSVRDRVAVELHRLVADAC